MPYLGDYLGHILSEITIARMQADIEAVRIAELYAEHPFLRTMPVPRFRMPEVELEIPVVISELESPPAGGSTQTAPSITELRKVFDGVLAARLKEEKIELNPALRTKLKRVLDRTTLSLTKPPEVGIDMHRVAIEFSKVTLKSLSETLDPKKLAEFDEKLRTAVQAEFLKHRTLPLRLNTLITTAQVKEAGPNEVITRLHLKLVEESYEWTTVGTDDEKQDRLVIE